MFIMNLWSYIYYRFIFEDIPGHFYLSSLKIDSTRIYLFVVFISVFIYDIYYIYLFIYSIIYSLESYIY